MIEDDDDLRTYEEQVAKERSTGPSTAGQSGDTQGLFDGDSESESVVELLEEGQTFEAETVLAFEDAPDADVEELHTRQFPLDEISEEDSDEGIEPE